MKEIFSILLSYLSGAIPFGVIIARHFYHINIREHGSRNTGATNVWRVLGPLPGIATLILDALKGALPVVLTKLLFPASPGMAILNGFVSIIGHNWSVFLKGRGGKGVATSAGVFLALMPKHSLIALAAFAVFFFTTKHVSVGSMAGAVSLIASAFFWPTPPVLQIVVVASALLLLIKHIPNMKRLAKGEEPKVKLG